LGILCSSIFCTCPNQRNLFNFAVILSIALISVMRVASSELSFLFMLRDDIPATLTLG
jgi:hypothetical protein